MVHVHIIDRFQAGRGRSYSIKEVIEHQVEQGLDVRALISESDGSIAIDDPRVDIRCAPTTLTPHRNTDQLSEYRSWISQQLPTTDSVLWTHEGADLLAAHGLPHAKHIHYAHSQPAYSWGNFDPEALRVACQQPTAFMSCGPVVQSALENDYSVRAPFRLGFTPVLPSPEPTARTLPGSPALVSLSRMDRNKNLPVILSAMPAVRDAFPDVHFTNFGYADDIGYERELRTMIVDLGLEGCVTLRGFTADAAEHLPGADIYVSASLTEGLRRSVVEAMSCGLAVTSSHCMAWVLGDNTELSVRGEGAKDEQRGTVFDPRSAEDCAEAIIRAAINPSRYGAGTPNRLWAEREFGAQRWARVIAEVVEL